MNCDFKDSADPLAARFCDPMGVAQDHSGNIIVTDYYTGRVRKVWRDGSQSGVTTIAGNGPLSASGGSSIDSDNPLDASFFTPFGIAIDGAGNILVSALHEHRVRVILVNGSVRTLAGSGPSTDLNTATTGAFIDNVRCSTRFSQPYFLAIVNVASTAWTSASGAGEGAHRPVAQNGANALIGVVADQEASIVPRLYISGLPEPGGARVVTVDI